MYILKNALTSIKRNKGRNILIAIIIIVISASCAITLAIRESANKVVNAYKEKNPIEATIGMDRRTLMNSLSENNKSQEDMINAFNDIKAPTEEEIINYGSSNYVKEYYYTYSLGVDAKDLTEATDSLVKETTEVKTEIDTKTRTIPDGGENRPRKPGEDSNSSTATTTTSRRTTTKKTEKIFNEKAQNGAFTLIGYNSYEDMKDFINGNYTITSGEVSSDFNSNSCVISEELASLNNLSVGDKITIVDTNNNDKTYELYISGIYKENTEQSSSMSSMFSSSANNIITNINQVKQIVSNNSDNLTPNITPTFILNSKEDIEKFANEIKEKGLSEYYQVSSNIEELENATKSIENVKTFSETFLIITLIIGAVVLVVINMINIRERKYEIGVLRTIGMKKIKVSIQFMLELLIVCMFALSIGSAIGASTSVNVANSLLANEIANTNEEVQDISKNFGKENSMPSPDVKKEFKVAEVNQISDINAIVDFKVLAQLFGIGILLTLISSLASMIAISRFSPLTILKERS